MKNKIVEANRNSIILVDFQPEYSSAAGYEDAISAALGYINEHPNATVTAFFNGADVGIEDTIQDIAWHFMEHGLDEDRLDDFKMVEKTYAFLRNWMDQGVSPATIIKTIRYLVQHGLNDSREIDEEILKELLGDEWDENLVDDMIYIPDISIANLRRLSNSLVGGGGRHECLAELQLLMNAFNIKYKLVDNWIY